MAKTRKRLEGGGEGDKVFINIVKSDKIDAPTQRVVKDGSNWSVPYSLGPPHMEKDKKDENSACFDCCFHPEAIDLGMKHKQFRDLLVHTAMDGVEESYRRQHQEVRSM